MRARSSRAQTIHRAFDAAGAEHLRALVQQSPRTFDKPTGVWTLELAAGSASSKG